MIAKLNGPLRREIPVGRAHYVVTISPAGLKLALKGKRNGYEVDWEALVSGDAALAAALNASLEAPLLPNKRTPATTSRKAARKRKPLPGRS
jgi:hypothetical protein